MGINDGGPAFPVGINHGYNEPYPGMSLRDYFAGMALQGILASGNFDKITLLSKKRNLEPGEITTKLCYEYADAMLAEREK